MLPRTRNPVHRIRLQRPASNGVWDYVARLIKLRTRTHLPVGGQILCTVFVATVFAQWHREDAGSHVVRIPGILVRIVKLRRAEGTKTENGFPNPMGSRCRNLWSMLNSARDSDCGCCQQSWNVTCRYARDGISPDRCTDTDGVWLPGSRAVITVAAGGTVVDLSAVGGTFVPPSRRSGWSTGLGGD